MNISDADIKRNFDMYDRDRSGNITIQEMKQIYAQFNVPVNDQQLQYLVSKYDTNRDGQIGYPEFYFLLTGRQAAGYPPAGQQGQQGFGQQGQFGQQRY